MNEPKILEQAIKEKNKHWFIQSTDNAKLRTSANDIVEIRKAARLIAQGTRNSESLFCKLPSEIGVKIAADCSNGSVSKQIAQSVAQENFGRPNTNP